MWTLGYWPWFYVFGSSNGLDAHDNSILGNLLSSKLSAQPSLGRGSLVQFYIIQSVHTPCKPAWRLQTRSWLVGAQHTVFCQNVSRSHAAGMQHNRTLAHILSPPRLTYDRLLHSW